MVLITVRIRTTIDVNHVSKSASEGYFLKKKMTSVNFTRNIHYLLNIRLVGKCFHEITELSI